MFELPHQSRHLRQGRSDALTMKLGQIWTNPPRFASQKSCLKRIWRSPVPFHTSFCKQPRCLWISALLNKHLESSRFWNMFIWNRCEYLRVGPKQNSDLALDPFPLGFLTIRFHWFHDCRSHKTENSSPESQRRKWKHCQRAQIAEGPLAWPHVIKDRQTSQVAWQKAYLNFLNFIKIWVLDQNEDDYTAGCHVLNKAMLQQWSLLNAFRVCVISICLPALVFALQKFGLKASWRILPLISTHSKHPAESFLPTRVSCFGSSCMSDTNLVAASQCQMHCLCLWCICNFTNFTPSHAKGKSSI